MFRDLIDLFLGNDLLDESWDDWDDVYDPIFYDYDDDDEEENIYNLVS